MRILLLLFLSLSLHADDLSLAREMLEDVIIRNDVEGIDLVRGRLMSIAAEADDKTVVRDAHYLAALSVFFETYSGSLDAAAIARIRAAGARHADRAVELDPQFAEARMLSFMLRGSVKQPPALDPKSTTMTFFSGVMRSINPAGAAPAEGSRSWTTSPRGSMKSGPGAAGASDCGTRRRTRGGSSCASRRTSRGPRRSVRWRRSCSNSVPTSRWRNRSTRA